MSLTLWIRSFFPHSRSQTGAPSRAHREEIIALGKVLKEADKPIEITDFASDGSGDGDRSMTTIKYSILDDPDRLSELERKLGISRLEIEIIANALNDDAQKNPFPQPASEFRPAHYLTETSRGFEMLPISNPQLIVNPLLTFQVRVLPWLLTCFGKTIADDKTERSHRFLEESLELVQACGVTKSEVYQLVEYVYGRPVGEVHQEIGGTMITLAGLCLAHQQDMHEEGERELQRVWTKVPQIRAKRAGKPTFSPLPE